jgi:hypothetical protein
MMERAQWTALVGQTIPEARRVKRAEISLRMLRELFTTGYRPPHYEIADGIPVGARIVGATVDPSREVVVLFVEHEDFPEIPLDSEAFDALYITARQHTFEDCRWGEGKRRLGEIA